MKNINLNTDLELAVHMRGKKNINILSSDDYKKYVQLVGMRGQYRAVGKSFMDLYETNPILCNRIGTNFKMTLYHRDE